MICVVGIGNRCRGDDGAGPAVIERLRDVPDLCLIEVADDPLPLLDACEACHILVLVDAVVTGTAPGTVHRWDLTQDAPPVRALRMSTHGVNILDVLALAQALGRCPSTVLLYGVEGRDFQPGKSLSAPVVAGVEKVAAQIRALVQPGARFRAPDAVDSRAHPSPCRSRRTRTGGRCAPFRGWQPGCGEGSAVSG